MSKKLNVAIIGQGRSGMDIHGKYLLTNEGKEFYNVVAVVDMAEDRREKAKKTFDCDVYASHTELYGRDDIDLVINSTFSHNHYSVSMDLLTHGFNVVSEKPFSKYAMDCEKLVNAAKENNVMLSVFQNSRFAPYYTRLKEIIASGVLGELQHIYINFSGFARRWDWQCSNRYYGGCLLNTGPHPMDQALDLLDTDDMPNVFSVLKKANSAGDAEDYAKVILTHPGKPLIDIEIMSINAYSDCTYRVYGTKGSLKLKMDKIEYKYHDDKPMPELSLEPLRLEDGISPAYCSEELKWNEVTEDIEGSAFDIGTATFYRNIYNHLTNGEPLKIRPEKIVQQIRVMELIHAQNPMDTIY